MSRPSQSGGHALFRACAFEQDHVEDLDLIERSRFASKKLATLVDGGLHNRIVIAGKRDLRTVRLEEILVDMEAWPKGFESRFQPLHRVLLLGVVEALVVHALNVQHHPEVAGLGEECSLDSRSRKD